MVDAITSVDEASYEQEVVNSALPVLIDFWAPWCGPCMSLMPVVEAIAPLYERQVKVVKINADENPALMEKFGVRGIPQLFLLRDGNVVASLKERSRTRLSLELDGLLS